MSQPSQPEDTSPGCQGDKDLSHHAMVELGYCGHAVNGAIHTYVEYGCPDCGVTARKGPVSFACGRRIKAVQPTAENCYALKWKADRAQEAQP